MSDDTSFMLIALEEAHIAYEEGEIPVGAVIVRQGVIIARAHNRNRIMTNPLWHAEMIAIDSAAGTLGNERLNDCTLYVTKEPCVMCAGAIVHARIERLVIAAEDVKYGACGTVFSVCGNNLLNHVPEIVFGVQRDEASALLTAFFTDLRNEKKLKGPSSRDT
ncbi:MAG TPA: nucleoside deaminase [Spirochaetota bacterium]|nr:nucleoside deaminase [Spirochaetota bacterium]